MLKSCWARKHQRLALEGSREDKEEEDQVDLVLEMDQTLEGCWAKVDVGGLKRRESVLYVERAEVLIDRSQCCSTCVSERVRC